MRVRCGIVTLVVALITRSGASDNSVHIYDRYPDLRVTSSTLKWVSEQGGKHPPTAVQATADVPPEQENEATAVEMEPEYGSKPVFVCRAFHSGFWLPGELRAGSPHCRISVLGKVYPYSQYEVLDNIENGALLNWTTWERRYPVLPRGAVLGGDSGRLDYIARWPVPAEAATAGGYAHQVGRFDPKEGFGKVFVIEGVGKLAKEVGRDEGEILVEKEPIRYEVNSIEFVEKRRREERERTLLGAVTLRNDMTEGGPERVDSVVDNCNRGSEYWGQGRAMLKGKPTNFKMPDGLIRQEEFTWGIPYEEEHCSSQTVEYVLEPGTAVNVSVWGNLTRSEVPYYAKLVAVYENDRVRSRNISGEHIKSSMIELKVEYGPVYWLHNDSLVPTTTTTTTTTTSTTTTTTTTTRPKEEDNTIQGDDGKVHQAVAYQKNMTVVAAGHPVPSASPQLDHQVALLIAAFAAALLRIA